MPLDIPRGFFAGGLDGDAAVFSGSLSPERSSVLRLRPEGLAGGLDPGSRSAAEGGRVARASTQKSEKEADVAR